MASVPPSTAREFSPSDHSGKNDPLTETRRQQNRHERKSNGLAINLFLTLLS